ncbi:MAG: LamG domain-containing protein, partial [Phycisphaerae bacterium]
MIATASFLAQMFLSGMAHAQQSALINGDQEPYTLSDAQYDYGFQQQAVRVTGAAGYASVPDTATLVQPASFTLEAFVMLESAVTGSGIIASRRGSAAQDWQWWVNSSGAVIFNGFAASSAPVGTVTSIRRLSLNQWHHVCISVDPNRLVSIYIDGDPDIQATLSGPVNTSAASAIPMYVAGSGIAGRVFPGLVGDVRFYAGAVSPERLAEAMAMLGTDVVGSVAHQFALIDAVQRPLTLTSAVYDNGFQDQAVRVTGSTGYAAVPFTARLVEPASFTFEALVKMDAYGTGSGMIASRRGATSQDWQLYCNANGQVIFNGFSASGTPVGTLTTPQKLNLGEWYHVCAAVDEAQIGKIYIDGNMAATGTLTGPVNSSASSAIQLQVGGSGVAGRIFPGLVGDARLYGGVVSNERLLEAQTLTHPWNQSIARNLVMGFEQEGAWCTAPVGLLDVMSEGALLSAKAAIAQDYRIDAVPFYDLALGATLDATRFTEGTRSLLWNDHPKYPTLACWKVDGNWSSYQTVGFSIYSAAATGELVTMAVLSDSSVTVAKDYFTYTFAINWTGWKTV